MAAPNARPNRNREIRKRHAVGESMSDLAREYGISRQRVDQIVNFRRHLARERFRRALEDGTLSRQDECSRCGAGGQIEAHHPDYGRPLHVEWLCRACHADEHRGRHVKTRVPGVVVRCEHCGNVMYQRAQSDVRYCSTECAGLAKRFDRSERMAECADTLKRFVREHGYVPGSTEFASAVTGSATNGTPILCQNLDPHQAEFGTYAATMDALYEEAGFERPTYGRLPVELIGTVGMTEAAEILGMQRSHTTYHIRNNGLPCVEGEGHTRRFWPHEILAWKSDRERSAA